MKQDIVVFQLFWNHWILKRLETNLSYFKFNAEFVFKIDDLVKQSRPGYKEPVITCKAYPPDTRLSVYLRF